MKILIVGSGAREYSIALSLLNDTRTSQIYFSPGNGATVELGENIYTKDNDELVRFCVDNRIDLVVVGPEAPLVAGLGDKLRAAGIRTFAPSQKAAKLEGSKVFMKNLLQKYNIPTARFTQGRDKEALFRFIDSLGGESGESSGAGSSSGAKSSGSSNAGSGRIVLKADGLCGGKGVVIVDSKENAKATLEAMLSGELFGSSGESVVIEEFLDGFELSVFAVCDGRDFVVLPAAQDHKRLLDNDMGPNTGGMGAYAPTPLCSKTLLGKIKTRIIKPTLAAMKKEGAEFCGVLFCGIMVVNDEPFVLEFNVRFGDPECEVILPLLKTPLLDIFNATIDGTLGSLKLEIFDKHCVGVVAASSEYPYATAPREKITLGKVNFLSNQLSHISFAGVETGVGESRGELYANGGRVLVAVGVGESLQNARDEAYDLLKKATFNGAKIRYDIANRALQRAKIK